MEFFKNVNEGYIDSVSTGNGQTKITKQEYDAIIEIAHNAPKAPEGFQYKLRNNDMGWELVEVPPAPVPSDEDATEQDYQNALNQMGVSFDESA